MINRELINATLLTYTTVLDQYGQPRQSSPSETSIQITKPKLYHHSQVEDIRFQDVTDTCFSFNKTIDTENEIRVDTTTYLVNFVNDEGRVAQIFLIKK